MAYLHRPTIVRPLLVALVLAAATLGAPAFARPAAAAGPLTSAGAYHSSVLTAAPVTATARLAPQPVTSTSGLTMVWAPSQVVSGGHLQVLVHTLPRAHVFLTLGFPDGTSVPIYHRASDAGYARFDPLIAYQPQGSAEDATVTVRAVLQQGGLDDTVTSNVAVLQHVILAVTLKMPGAVAVGHPLVVTVVSNQPGALVRFFRLTYPDGEVETLRGGYTNALGVYTRSVPVSRSGGTRGTLVVQAVVSYDGVQLSKSGRVTLRARNA